MDMRSRKGCTARESAEPDNFEVAVAASGESSVTVVNAAAVTDYLVHQTDLVMRFRTGGISRLWQESAGRCRAMSSGRMRSKD